MSEFDDQGQPTAAKSEPVTPAPAPSTPPAAVAGFDFNRPTIISVLYLAACVVGITGLIGLVLAYVWKGEPHEAWEDSHYTYLIRTFWIGLLGFAVGAVLSIILIGIFVSIAAGIWVLVRSVMSLLKAQKKEPMPDPQTWLI